MLLRDRLLARIAEMGATPDYARLAEEVLGIRHAPAALARRLVEQALVVEDRKEAWLRTGARICAEAPKAPGVYVLRDAEGRAVYVGKANDIRRRLRTHSRSAGGDIFRRRSRGPRLWSGLRSAPSSRRCCARRNGFVR
ncbi:MAG: GIY-YIG nuclease family protein [Vicinamibacterales bacterium]